MSSSLFWGLVYSYDCCQKNFVGNNQLVVVQCKGDIYKLIPEPTNSGQSWPLSLTGLLLFKHKSTIQETTWQNHVLIFSKNNFWYFYDTETLLANNLSHQKVSYFYDIHFIRNHFFMTVYISYWKTKCCPIFPWVTPLPQESV